MAASVLAAIDAGCDAVDGALDAMSGLTSQPNLGSIAAALQGSARQRADDLRAKEGDLLGVPIHRRQLEHAQHAQHSKDNGTHAKAQRREHQIDDAGHHDEHIEPVPRVAPVRRRPERRPHRFPLRERLDRHPRLRFERRLEALRGPDGIRHDAMQIVAIAFKSP